MNHYEFQVIAVESASVNVYLESIAYGLECCQHPDQLERGLAHLSQMHNITLEADSGLSTFAKMKAFIINLIKGLIASIKHWAEMSMRIVQQLTRQTTTHGYEFLARMQSSIKFKSESVVQNPSLATAWSSRKAPNAHVTTLESVKTVLHNHLLVSQASLKAFELGTAAQDAYNNYLGDLKNKVPDEPAKPFLSDFLKELNILFHDGVGKTTPASSNKEHQFSSFVSNYMYNGDRLTFVISLPTETHRGSLSAPINLTHSKAVDAAAIETLTPAVYKECLDIWKQIVEIDEKMLSKYKYFLSVDKTARALKTYADALEPGNATTSIVNDLVNGLKTLATINNQMGSKMLQLNFAAMKSFHVYTKACKEG